MGPTGFELWYGLYPRKVARERAQKAWDKLNPDDETQKKMVWAIGEQKRARKRQEAANEKLPQFSQKHIPDWPHPATWINDKRWLDDIPCTQEIAEKFSESKLCQCGAKAAITIDGESYCCHHYSRKYHDGHYRDMYENLKKMGLAKLKDETTHDYAMRCKEAARKLGYRRGDI